MNKLNGFKKMVFATLVSIFLTAALSAQVKIGLPVGKPNMDAVLDLSNAAGANKGLLLPSIALKSTTSSFPLLAMVAGMEIYNIATAGTGTTAVIPGIYLNDGIKWILQGTAGLTGSTGATG